MGCVCRHKGRCGARRSALEGGRLVERESGREGGRLVEEHTSWQCTDGREGDARVNLVQLVRRRHHRRDHDCHHRCRDCQSNWQGCQFVWQPPVTGNLFAEDKGERQQRKEDDRWNDRHVSVQRVNRWLRDRLGAAPSHRGASGWLARWGAKLPGNLAFRERVLDPAVRNVPGTSPEPSSSRVSAGRRRTVSGSSRALTTCVPSGAAPLRWPSWPASKAAPLCAATVRMRTGDSPDITARCYGRTCAPSPVT